MAVLTVISQNPLTAQIVFTAQEVAAVKFDAQQTGALGLPVTDPVAFFTARLQDVINASVRRFNDNTAQGVIQKFNAASAAQQQAAIAALGG